jgi:hypothetical protein
MQPLLLPLLLLSLVVLVLMVVVLLLILLPKRMLGAVLRALLDLNLVALWM